MKQRIYIDTSVFGGYFDSEFAEHTIPLFERLTNNEFVLLFSTVTQDELENAPENVKNLVKSMKTMNTEFLEISEEAVELVIESKDDNELLFLNEASDLLFHYLILLQAKGYSLQDVIEILKNRHKK